MNGGMFIGLRKEVAGALLLIVAIIFLAAVFQAAELLPGGSEAKKIEQNIWGSLNILLVLGGLATLILVLVVVFNWLDGLQGGAR